MKKISDLFERYTVLMMTLSVLVITPLSQLLPIVDPTIDDFGLFFIKTILGIILVVVSLFLLCVVFKLTNSIKDDLEKLANDYKINIFGLLSSKSFIDENGDTIWCTKKSYKERKTHAVDQHRIDGPAVIKKNGDVLWFLNDYRKDIYSFLNETPASEKIKAKIRADYAEHLI